MQISLDKPTEMCYTGTMDNQTPENQPVYTKKQDTLDRAQYFRTRRMEVDPSYREWRRLTQKRHNVIASNRARSADTQLPVPEKPPFPTMTDEIARLVYAGPLLTAEDIAKAKAERLAAKAAKKQARQARLKDINRNQRLRKNYGMGVDTFNTKLAAQGGCAICGATANVKWHVDHDHATGATRGILCGQCNVGLGFFGDSADRLDAASAYRRRYQ